MSRIASITVSALSMVCLVTAQLSVNDYCTVRQDGSQGICKVPADCPSVVAQIQRHEKPTICSYMGRLSVVCCPLRDSSQSSANGNGNIRPGSNNARPSTRPQDNAVIRRNQGAGISVQKCTEYSRIVTEELHALPLLPVAEPISFNVPNCTLYKTPLIVGGEESRQGEFPHMVAIGFPLNNNYIFACGGSLISESYVITAAHCTYSQYANSPPTVARLGAHNLVNRDEGFWQDVAISSVHMHPNYAAGSRYNDIALLQLQSPVTFTSTIRPACLWQTENIQKEKAIATGWGKLGSTEEQSDVLMKVQLDLIIPSMCKEKIHAGKKLRDGILPTQLCAGDLTGGKNDTCQGDSGGPLVITSAGNQCVFYVLGITSFGYGCGSGLPAVYTRVSSYVPWIEDIVWPGN